MSSAGHRNLLRTGVCRTVGSAGFTVGRALPNQHRGVVPEGCVGLNMPYYTLYGVHICSVFDRYLQSSRREPTLFFNISRIKPLGGLMIVFLEAKA